MKDRLLTLALALGAFAAFYMLIAPKPPPPQERVTRPVSTEAGPNGYLGLRRWLEAEHVRTVSLRERYGQLQEVSASSPTGNLLISTTPHVYPIRSAEGSPLRAWIASGNTLLVLAGLSDTPQWSVGAGQDPEFMDHMELMTGLTFTAVPPKETQQESSVAPDAPNDDADSSDDSSAPQASPSAGTRDALAALRLSEPQRSEISSNGSHPLLDGVQSVAAVSEFPSSRWRAASQLALVLELAHERDSEVPALWLMRYGEGQIIVSAYGSVLTNKLLGEHDNARLLANIVRWSLAPKGQVIVDDAHQGLVSFYDPAKFFGDSRLHRTLWWLFALWLVFVLGPRRLRPALSSWNPIDVTSFVRATGGFMARVLKPATAGQELFANFFNEIRHRLGLSPDGTPAWEWIEAHAALAAGDLSRLRDLHQRVSQRRRIDLAELHNLLVRVRTVLDLNALPIGSSRAVD